VCTVHTDRQLCTSSATVRVGDEQAIGAAERTNIGIAPEDEVELFCGHAEHLNERHRPIRCVERRKRRIINEADSNQTVRGVVGDLPAGVERFSRPKSRALECHVTETLQETNCPLRRIVPIAAE
jgi:hypothetical protein